MTSTASKNAARNAAARAKGAQHPSGQRYDGSTAKTAEVVTGEHDEVRHSSDGDAIAVVEEKTQVTPKWTTYKGLGSPARFVFLGRASKAPGTPHLVVGVTQKAGSMQEFVDKDKLIVASFGTAGKFWGAVLPQDQPEATEDAKATQRAAKGEKAPRQPKTKNPCHCGCGAMVANLYKQGHDARHVSQLAATYEATVKGNKSAAEVKATRGAVFAEIQFSERLTAKLARSIEIIDAKVAKSAAAKQAAKASK